MTSLIVTCSICHAEYEPDHAEIMAGYRVWSRCPDCRGIVQGATEALEVVMPGRDPPAALPRRPIEPTKRNQKGNQP